jgi:hypothetical protein
MNMPEINLDAIANLTDEEKSIVKQTLNKGRLRASKPKKQETYTYQGRLYRRNLKGESAYVWRMLCFYLIDQHPHSCMPVSADFEVCDVSVPQSEVRKRVKELDIIVDKVMASLPSHVKRGLMRWQRVLLG